MLKECEYSKSVTIDTHLDELVAFCQDNGIRSLSLFGSFLHGNARSDSDIDLLVDFDPNQRVGLFALSRMELELTDLLNHPVDVRTPQDLSPYFRQRVLEEAAIIYSHG
jgi:predicted nucleotidyltransferase